MEILEKEILVTGYQEKGFNAICSFWISPWLAYFQLRSALSSCSALFQSVAISIYSNLQASCPVNTMGPILFHIWAPLGTYMFKYNSIPPHSHPPKDGNESNFLTHCHLTLKNKSQKFTEEKDPPILWVSCFSGTQAGWNSITHRHLSPLTCLVGRIEFDLVCTSLSHVRCAAS